MNPLKRTRTQPPVSATAEGEYESKLTDAAIYTLALGGFYITYFTLYGLALKVGFPVDQARVVAALADLAILAYSWKAKQEAEAGRSAWGIRLMVAALSAATFALQIKAAYPNPTAMVMHALAPAVWIFGHEMMLRGKLRRARAARRAREVADGLRPAPLEHIRAAEWLLAPRRTFQVWKMMILWRKTREFVTRTKVAQWQEAADTRRNGSLKPVPAAWQWVLAADLQPEPSAAAVRPTVTFVQHRPPVSVVLDAFKPVDLTLPEPHPQTAQAPTLPRPSEKPDSFRVIGGQKIPESFFTLLPEAPEKHRRTAADMEDYMREVYAAAAVYGFEPTGVLYAHLLDVAPSRISQLKKPEPAAA